MRCKQGILAEIVGGIDGLNLGKIVNVKSFAGTHSVHGPIWLVESRTIDLVTEYGAVGKTVHCADSWLKPIPTDPLPPKIKQKDLELVD